MLQVVYCTLILGSCAELSAISKKSSIVSEKTINTIAQNLNFSTIVKNACTSLQVHDFNVDALCRIAFMWAAEGFVEIGGEAHRHEFFVSLYAVVLEWLSPCLLYTSDAADE